MIQLSCHEVKKYYGAELVLENVTFEANEGERIALIGKNGTGKTTILRIITGEENLDGGTVSLRKGAQIGYLEQLPRYDNNKTVRQILELAFEEIFSIRENLDKLEKSMSEVEGAELERMLKRYSALSTEYEHKGGYEIEERLGRICTGLKLSDEFLLKPFNLLSGGEKTLAGLGKVLLQNPDILILDEPTNHLDISLLAWLEDYLKNYKGTVLMVSHDRYFLDLVANRVLEVADGCLTEYLGNYSYYVEEKRIRQENQLAAYKENQKKIKAMEKAIKDMRIWAEQADNAKMFKRAASMQKRLDRMDKVEKPKNEGKGMRVLFDEGERSGKDVLLIEELEKSFGEKQLFECLDMEVYFKEHIALIGRNGCGKTTLLKMVLGEENPDRGKIQIGASLKIGYLPQQVSFENEELTILETFRDGLTIGEGNARELLARYLFYADSVFKKVKNLSGGEKSRLLLAILMQKEVNFLILDEPTNHLDIVSRENLEEALLTFQGTILFVSHDRYFINRISTRILELENGEGVSYIGDYDFYHEKKTACETENKERLTRTSLPSRKELTNQKGLQGQKELPGKKGALIEGLQKDSTKQSLEKKWQKTEKPGKTSYKAERLEEEIKQLEAEKEQVELAISQTESDYVRLLELEKEKAEVEKVLEEKLEEWITYIG